MEEALGRVTNLLANGGRDFFDGFILEISFQVLSQFFTIETSLGDHLDIAPDDLSVAGREVGDDATSNPTLIGIRPGARLSIFKAFIDKSVNRSHVLEVPLGSFLSFIPDFGGIADLSFDGIHDLSHVFFGNAVFDRIAAGVCFSEVFVDEITDLFTGSFTIVDEVFDGLFHCFAVADLLNSEVDEFGNRLSFSSNFTVETHTVGFDEEEIGDDSLFVIFQALEEGLE